MFFSRFKKLSFLSSFSILISIFLTALLFGFLTVTMQSKLIVKEAQKRAEESSIGIAHMIVNLVLEKDYSRIIDIFNAISENKKIKSISLLDLNGVSKVIVEQSNIISFDKHKYITKIPVEYNEADYLITTVTPIADMGFLRIEMSVEYIKDLSKSAFWSGALISLFLAVMALLVNMLVMKKPLDEIESLSRYAADLPNHYGLDAPVANSAIELNILSQSLNTASHRLHEQTTELEANNTELIALNDELERRVDTQMAQLLSHERLLVQQSKMAAMGDMMGAVAHQWRQPLNALAITIQDAKFAYETGEMDKEYIGDMVKRSMENIYFMSKTIDDFRNFFKPTNEKKEFQISSVIKSVSSIIAPQLKNNGIEFTVDGEDFYVFGFASELSQVVLNIISNARDAILEKNSKGTNEWIRVYMNKEGFVTICDSGGGIANSAIEHMYEPYFTTKEQGKGTGIGLYMSKMIVEKHMNGELNAYNTEHGACFKIILSPFLPDEA